MAQVHGEVQPWRIAYGDDVRHSEIFPVRKLEAMLIIAMTPGESPGA